MQKTLSRAADFCYIINSFFEFLMAITANSTGQPPSVVDQPLSDIDRSIKPRYVDMVKPQLSNIKPIPLKPIAYLHGGSRVIWEEEEIEKIFSDENRQYTMSDNFLY